jgi:hypothetical protein
MRRHNLKFNAQGSGASRAFLTLGTSLPKRPMVTRPAAEPPMLMSKKTCPEK